MKKLSQPFPDHNQNFWQLACIQSAAQSLPSMVIGGILAQQFGVNVAISSICIGNLILWLIGLSVISMAAKERKNAIENTKEYLGRSGGLLLSIIMMIAFSSWYMLEIRAATISLTPLLKSYTGFNPIILGSTFGVLIAFISTGGIRLIKWIAVTAFPILLFFLIYSIFSSKSISFDEISHLSLPAIFIIISLSLPGMINLPTFFRHSKSQADSFLALTLISIFDILFQSFSVFTKITNVSEFINQLQNGSVYIIFSIIFVILSLICLNLVNIYFSSAALQGIFPRLTGPKGYLLVGLAGTVFYLLLQNSPSLLFLGNMTNNFIANVGVTLILSFLVSVIVKHRPRSLEKTISFSCCAFGCSISLISQIINPQFPDHALLVGCGGTILAFLLILFFEETTWAAKKVYK